MEKAEQLMRKYGYGYIHSKDLLNEPYVKELESVIDELEKWLKSERRRLRKSIKPINEIKVDVIDGVQYKIQELKKVEEVKE